MTPGYTQMSITCFKISNSVWDWTSGFIFLKPSTISYNSLLLIGASLTIEKAPPLIESAMHSEGQWPGHSHRKQTPRCRVCVESTGGDGGTETIGIAGGTLVVAVQYGKRSAAHVTLLTYLLVSVNLSAVYIILVVQIPCLPMRPVVLYYANANTRRVR